VNPEKDMLSWSITFFILIKVDAPLATSASMPPIMSGFFTCPRFSGCNRLNTMNRE